MLKELNKQLSDLNLAANAWNKDMNRSKNFISDNLSLKLRSDLEGFDWGYQ